ncbi:hypothetical protein [Ranid herpesvirus 3]|uniref:C-type lectin protein n=1 Tax=Ranid herpesvirus 3 TaxID=1987509 RepID=A0A1X9T5I6_9VIRU|nr:hypothetical protein [Ranid herpesvirus 3]ARR28961.1 hypothetical protein [Ranid herpesvirus 3]
MAGEVSTVRNKNNSCLNIKALNVIFLIFIWHAFLCVNLWFLFQGTGKMSDSKNESKQSKEPIVLCETKTEEDKYISSEAGFTCPPNYMGAGRKCYVFYRRKCNYEETVINCAKNYARPLDMEDFETGILLKKFHADAWLSPKLDSQKWFWYKTRVKLSGEYASGYVWKVGDHELRLNISDHSQNIALKNGVLITKYPNETFPLACTLNACPPNYYRSFGMCYRTSWPKKYNFHEAVIECALDGTRLYSAHTDPFGNFDVTDTWNPICWKGNKLLTLNGQEVNGLSINNTSLETCLVSTGYKTYELVNIQAYRYIVCVV